MYWVSLLFFFSFLSGTDNMSKNVEEDIRKIAYRNTIKYLEDLHDIHRAKNSDNIQQKKKRE